ncbi:hypothetical protein S7711_04808 [Stachybotrys chartarum IBT 7711]|uniref:Uncharacterized protein n=1 Tax=Stachybotrys chartarum (strain CBS 109288 / IBT 7711) TaxID=1280523 RepID=A0A084AME8_STACB|nr:hypothetical protein S7711_04808 [Stachybotrys chartarum IBT 7711]KFA55014.1 hypothetical protein S40293_10614 [Stachybotrys chartarum IBT 40293]
MTSLLACVRRAMRWSFLALLLLHVPFILNGLVGGLFWAREVVALEGRMVQHYLENMETARRREWFSIPGGPGILDSIVAPYFIPQLHTPGNDSIATTVPLSHPITKAGAPDGAS